MYPLFNSRLLASITGANNMLLIWLQETVSRQLNFQLLSHGERMHKTYLYLSCMKAGSDAHIPVSCNSRIKRNVNTSAQLNAATYSLHSGNLLLVSLGILTSTWNVRQSTEVQLTAPCKKSEYGAAGQATKGTAPCPMPPPSAFSSSWPFTLLQTGGKVPPLPSKHAQHKINREANGATTLPRDRVG